MLFELLHLFLSLSQLLHYPKTICILRSSCILFRKEDLISYLNFTTEDTGPKQIVTTYKVSR